MLSLVLRSMGPGPVFTPNRKSPGIKHISRFKVTESSKQKGAEPEWGDSICFLSEAEKHS